MKFRLFSSPVQLHSPEKYYGRLYWHVTTREWDTIASKFSPLELLIASSPQFVEKNDIVESEDGVQIPAHLVFHT